MVMQTSVHGLRAWEVSGTPHITPIPPELLGYRWYPHNTPLLIKLLRPFVKALTQFNPRLLTSLPRNGKRAPIGNEHAPRPIQS